MSEERDREREDEEAPRSGRPPRQSPRSRGGVRGRPGGRRVEEQDVEDFYVRASLPPRFVEGAVHRAYTPRGFGGARLENLGALLMALPTIRAGGHGHPGPPTELVSLMERLRAAYEPPVRPADPSFVAALPRASITPTLVERREACTVCLEEYELGEEDVVALPCGHLYHKRCVLGWFVGDNRCPVCRSPLPESGSAWQTERSGDLRVSIDEEGFDDAEMAAAVAESNAVEQQEDDTALSVDPLHFAIYDSLAGLTTVELRQECDAAGLLGGGAANRPPALCLTALCERHGLSQRTVERMEACRAALR